MRRGAGLAVFERDLRALALAVVAGASLVYTLPQLPALLWFVPALALCLLRFPGRTLVAVLVLTAAWTTYRAERQMQHRLPAAQTATIRWMHGHIASLPARDAIRSRFAFVTDARPRRLRLSWYGDAPPLQLGDCYDLKVKLFAPHGSANPGGFDYEAWLWREGIGATGYIKAAHGCTPSAATWVGQLRARVVTALDDVLGTHPMRGIIEALTVGVTTHISDAQWRVFRNTGTSHIVAISGWHIGLVAGWLLFFARWLLLRLPGRWPMRLPVLPLSALIAVLGAGVYALLAGLGLPTLRALIMLSAGLAALLHARRMSFGRVLAVAAIMVVLWHPLSVLAPGFWLSFGAVAWIVYLVHSRPRGKLALFAWLQFGLALGLAPLTLYIFSQASLVSPLVNAMLLPLAGLFVPLLLLSVVALVAWPPLGAPCVHFCAHLLAGFWPLMQWLADWPLATLVQPVPGMLAVALALLGVALLLAPRGVPARWLGALFLLPLLLGWRPPGQAIPLGGYRLAVLDVGQGLAVALQTRHHTLVYDAGPAFRTGFNAGGAIVAPYLRHARIRRIDTLMISHADNDHIGGAAVLARRLPVERRMGAGSDMACHAGQAWRWDGVEFRVLHPLAAQPDLSKNNGSCVLRITGAGGVTLLTGDIEAPAEQALVERADPAVLAADIVVVPHHGSATSSSRALIAASRPSHALISSGWHNRWHFPAPEVVARYQKAGAQVLDTADSGALLATVYPQQAIRVRRWRVVHPRLWQIPDPD